MASKIMVIDDSLLVRTQVARTLTTAGFTVVEAFDGRDGLDKLITHSDVGLVVCDVNMPRMNGIEFLEQVQKGIPVVMLTTEGQPDLIQQAKALGAKGWLLKPFKPDLLVATARRLTGAT